MLPFIKIPDPRPESFAINYFGLLVLTGVIVGVILTIKRAKRLDHDLQELKNFIIWILFFGFTVSHMANFIFYHPEKVLKNPWSLFFIWQSMSSFGGFIGAVMGAVMWKYFHWQDGVKWGWFKRRENPMPLLPFIDMTTPCFAIAWIFGRTGCSIVHDHLGVDAPADSWFAIATPAFKGDGETIRVLFFDLIWGSRPRYDLGLLELFLTLFIVAIILLMWRKKRPLGSYVAVIALLYSPVRFILDFYRMSDGPTGDLRHAGLTFAQWCCIAFFMHGLYMVRFILTIPERELKNA